MTTSLLQHYRDEIVRIHGHIDARGVMQVQRIVHLKLDDVYVSLKARLRQDRSAPFERRKRDGGRNGSGRPSGPMSDEAEREAGWAAFFEPAAREERGVSLEDLWRRHRYWVLLGDPGAGKTTVLRHLAYQGAREGDPLPVYITLRYLANEQSRHGWGAQDTLLCYLQDFGLAELGFDPEERAALVAEIRARLEAGRAVLLLDGLDEQREPEMKQKTREAIESLIRRYPQNRCLCSSRITGYDAAPLGAEFQTAELEPYSDEQMREFFRRWLMALERGEDLLGDPEAAARRAAPKAEALIGQVEAHAGVRALASNPLLCTVIALIHRQGGTLPQHRAELYKLCTDTFIFNWEMHKRRLGQTDEGLDKDETQAVLEQIAPPPPCGDHR